MNSRDCERGRQWSRSPRELASLRALWLAASSAKEYSDVTNSMDSSDVFDGSDPELQCNQGLEGFL
jgi:hypothetical protein